MHDERTKHDEPAVHLLRLHDQLDRLGRFPSADAWSLRGLAAAVVLSAGVWLGIDFVLARALVAASLAVLLLVVPAGVYVLRELRPHRQRREDLLRRIRQLDAPPARSASVELAPEPDAGSGEAGR